MTSPTERAGADEIERLLSPARRVEARPPETVELAGHTSHPPGEVLERIRQVLVAVLTGPAEGTVDRLPRWFIDSLAPRPYEPGLAGDLGERWTLDGWLYWFEPEQRFWTWWEGWVEPPDRVVIAVVAPEWPFSWEALQFLVRAAGVGAVDDPL